MRLSCQIWSVGHRCFSNLAQSDMIKGGKVLREGIRVSDEAVTLRQKALDVLMADAAKIRRLIEVQLDHLTAPQCPVFEEVLDTQMFGLSKEIDFAVRVGLISREVGRQIMNKLEAEVSKFQEHYERQRQLFETKSG